MRRRRWLLIIMLLPLLAAAGCAEGTGHITIHKNGSMDVNLNVGMNQRTAMFMVPQIDGKIGDKTREAGFEFEADRSDGSVEYRIAKHYDSIQTADSKLNLKIQKILTFQMMKKRL